MDVTNAHLKRLLSRTDEAFNALRAQPESAELTLAYEDARAELNAYVKKIRCVLHQRSPTR
ncbi:hypothetical protein OCL06_12625 [Alteromonas sp. ASW11-19]|uniref:Uncharacterized protein n=1 Tax=Alteromonas salexigens TaxID=2982530 RepID=A0ABT2VQ65_9ALTE|nr:hypothetical protein [Alteromonas salexigens]MCU7555432.1 hypothetical protein [Alteromonas salexigens]